MLKNKVKLFNAMEVHAESKKLPKKKGEEVKPKKVQRNYVKTIDDRELQLAEGIKLVFSVAQSSQDNPAHVDIRTWVESEKYTGPTKKGINFDIELLDEIIEILKEVSSECEKAGV